MASPVKTSACRLAALGLASEGAVRMAPVLGLPQLLRDHGVDSDAFIRGQGCDPALFTDPDNTIDFRAIGRLLAHAAAVTGCRYPGLALGRQQGIETLGLVGRAAQLAPDVATALRSIILNMHLHDRGSVPYLWIDKGLAVFGYTLYCAEIIGTEHIYDAALAIAHNLIHQLAGPGWRATEVRFFRDPPEDATPFREHFCARLLFGAPQGAIVFPSADLQRSTATADPRRYAAALRDLEALDVLSSNGMADKVRRLLLSLLVSGTGLSEAGLDRAAVADLIAVHPRTLNRRLRAEGKSFAALLAEARYDIARELLRDTRLQVHDIADILGYSDTVSFIHAFRRWSGMTATAWRADHGLRPGTTADSRSPTR